MSPRVAILIDGGYFLKRVPQLGYSLPQSSPEDYADEASRILDWMVNGHLEKLNDTYTVEKPWSLLHRVFFYDAYPYRGEGTLPISKDMVDFGQTQVALYRRKLLNKIKSKRKFMLRLGEVVQEREWLLKAEVQDKLLSGELPPDQLADDDFLSGMRQKGVDMRIGLDIAVLTLKKQADIIILVSGDSDFVPAAKLARREGMEFILDPLWQSIKYELYEHVDGLTSGLWNRTQPAPASVRRTGDYSRDDRLT